VPVLEIREMERDRSGGRRGKGGKRGGKERMGKRGEREESRERKGEQRDERKVDLFKRSIKLLWHLITDVREE
jgi:hypothetical protein